MLLRLINRGGPKSPQGTTSAGEFSIWNGFYNLHKKTRKSWISAALHNHALFVFSFLKSSEEPEQSTWAKHTSQELYNSWHQFGRTSVEFFTDCRTRSTAHESRDWWTLSHITEVKEHRNWIIKLKQVNKEVEAAKHGPQRHTAGSWVRFRSVSGVCGTGALCNPNRPGAGNTRPNPGTVASCHTFHTPAIKIPERIRSRHHIQSCTLSRSFSPSACQRSHLSTAPAHSLATCGAPPPTHWYRRRPQCPRHPDGVSVTTPGRRFAARSVSEKGQSIREYLGVDVTVNHKGLPAETRGSVSTGSLLEERWVNPFFPQSNEVNHEIVHSWCKQEVADSFTTPLVL